MDRFTYFIALKPMSDCSHGEVMRGLRWLLKRSFRQYGLKCIEIKVIDGKDQKKESHQ